MSLFKEKKSFFGKLSERISDVIMARGQVDEDLMDELEEVLITSDIGMDTTVTIMDKLRDFVKEEYVTKPENVKKGLQRIMTLMVDKGKAQKLSDNRPLVILMIGINGGGKTTTIGKLAHRLKNEGNTVMLAAADTFRAAAAEQLVVWGERNDINVIKHQEGADPSAVIYDAIQSAKAKNIDVLICDTAGRLQNKKNLMNELEKMNKVISREYPEADRETLLVLDATTGKNAISQAQEFGQVADITGIVLTKLDGTAKGGIAITIAKEYDMPIKFIGVGEGIEDLEEFDAKSFIGGIFDE
jgi:fused signal recognition particle receptor